VDDFAHNYLVTILIPGPAATRPLHPCGSRCTRLLRRGVGFAMSLDCFRLECPCFWSDLWEL
jgi:hypothetical protein